MSPYVPRTCVDCSHVDSAHEKNGDRFGACVTVGCFCPGFTVLPYSCLDCDGGRCPSARVFFCDPCKLLREQNNTDPKPGEISFRKKIEGGFNGGLENAMRALEEAS